LNASTISDVESDFAISQLHLENFLRREERLGNFLHIDDTEYFFNKKQNDDRFQRAVSTADAERTRTVSFRPTLNNLNWGINT
jgi:hypothetical protein